MPSFKSKQTMPAPAAQMGVAKSDFSWMRQSRSDLIMNAERFARIDLDRSRFEKERNHYVTRSQQTQFKN